MRPPDRSIWPMPGPRLLGVALVAVVAAALWLWTRSTAELAPGGPPAADHSVVIHFRLSDGKFGAAGEVARLMELEQRIEAAIETASVGELDGNEVGGGEFVVFTYGPDADRLYAVIEPLLRESALAKAGFAMKRYGAADDPDAVEARIDLGAGT